jgi:hypothetical protein
MSSLEDIEQMLTDCENRESKLSEWETNFIDELGKRVGRGELITDRQDEKLTQIWERVTK